MQGVKIITGLYVVLLLGCSASPVLQDNRADEQKANADKAHKELSQEIKRTQK